MSGDKVCSPKSGACTIIVYYSYSLGIPTYQKALFLHVYIQLWPLRKNSSLEKPSRACARVIDIDIQHARAGDEEIYQKWTLNDFQTLCFCHSYFKM